MSEFIPFPSIEQFRNTIHDIQTENKDQDILTFTGTIKLHGANAGISYCKETNTYCTQSRKKLIDVESDNYNFAKFTQKYKDNIIKLFDQIYSLESVRNTDTVIFFREWCGKGIQQNVGIAELDKMFVIFDIQIKSESKLDLVWLSNDIYKNN